ncbi:MAG: cytochrome C oxidase subunit IV family protein [Gemmatimonadota bacterium]|nr:cytochrome C oxidase subunit IV family protein [Gemmatimonadota bacterium]
MTDVQQPGAAEEHHLEHPNYWVVWAALAALTMVELGVAFLPWSRRVVVLLLIGLAVWKALLVALYFMHLRFEKNRMRIFALAPLPLTVIIVIAVLTEFVW